MSPAADNTSIETPPRAPSPLHKFGTLAVHAGSPHDPSTGAVIESVRISTSVFFATAFIKSQLDFTFHYVCADRSWETNWYLRILKKFESESVN